MGLSSLLNEAFYSFQTESHLRGANEFCPTSRFLILIHVEYAAGRVPGMSTFKLVVSHGEHAMHGFAIPVNLLEPI